MKRSRMTALAVATAIATGLAACGGDDDKKDEPAATTTTDQGTSRKAGNTQQDRAAKVELQAGVRDYNRGYRRFVGQLKDAGGDLKRLQSAIYAYRGVIYQFDKDLRAIEFRDELVPQVNSILESNLNLIEQLDAIYAAKTFKRAEKMYREFLRDRTPTIKAVNNLLRQLGGEPSGS